MVKWNRAGVNLRTGRRWLTLRLKETGSRVAMRAAAARRAGLAGLDLARSAGRRIGRAATDARRAGVRWLDCARSKGLQAGLSALHFLRRGVRWIAVKRRRMRKAVVAWLKTPLAYWTVHLPLALAGVWVIIDHERAMAAFSRLLAGAGGVEAVPICLAGAFVGLAVLDHLWHCLRAAARMPRSIRHYVLMDVPSTAMFFLVGASGAG